MARTKNGTGAIAEPKNKRTEADKTVKAINKNVAEPKTSQKNGIIKHPPTSALVTNAFTNLKTRKGITLAAIRNFVAKSYGIQMTKARQTLIRKELAKAFDEGRIKMTNDDKGVIDFTKRFKTTNMISEASK